MIDIIAETERLRLRHLHTDDAPFILRLLNESGFLRFIGDRGVHTVEDATSYIERVALASYRGFGFGLYAVELKDRRTAIGMCGLMRKPWLDAPDLAYAFLAAAEGRGHASEAARAVLNHAWNQLGVERVVAVVVPDNAASVRVLAKLGFTARGSTVDPHDGSALDLYATERARDAATAGIVT